jgi:hypothetical protein
VFQASFFKTQRHKVHRVARREPSSKPRQSNPDFPLSISFPLRISHSLSPPPPLSSPLRVLCASVFQTLHIRESISTHGSPSGPRRQVSPHEN